MLYDRADSMANAPRYLLLFGNCAYDNRMITTEWKKHNPDDYLLAYERSDEENKVGAYGIGTIHDYVTDDYYALLDDGEGNNIASERSISVWDVSCAQPRSKQKSWSTKP